MCMNLIDLNRDCLAHVMIQLDPDYHYVAKLTCRSLRSAHTDCMLLLIGQLSDEDKMDPEKVARHSRKLQRAVETTSCVRNVLQCVLQRDVSHEERKNHMRFWIAWLLAECEGMKCKYGFGADVLLLEAIPGNGSISRQAMRIAFKMFGFKYACEGIAGGFVTKAVAAHGDLKMLKWLHSKGYPVYTDASNEAYNIYADYDAATSAAYAGRCGILDWMVEKLGYIACEVHCEMACCGGHLDAIKWYIEDHSIEPTSIMMMAAVHETDDADIVEYLFNKNCPWNSAYTGGKDEDGDWCTECPHAASVGNQPMLKYLRALGAPWGETVEAALTAGHFKVAAWAKRKGAPVPEFRDMIGLSWFVNEVADRLCGPAGDGPFNWEQDPVEFALAFCKGREPVCEFDLSDDEEE